MKSFFTAFALAAALAVSIQTVAAAAEKNLTVVELYTSQGCSSCPPADAFLGELAKRDQGANHATGSDRDKILALIAKAQKSKRVAVTINRAEDGVRVTVAGADTTEEAAVWLAVFDNRHDTDIKRGENNGRTLSYYNVVRGMKRIGTWKGRPLDIPTGNTDLSTEGRDGCAVIVQSVSTGRIRGAAKLVLTGS